MKRERRAIGKPPAFFIPAHPSQYVASCSSHDGINDPPKWIIRKNKTIDGNHNDASLRTLKGPLSLPSKHAFCCELSALKAQSPFCFTAQKLWFTEEDQVIQAAGIAGWFLGCQHLKEKAGAALQLNRVSGVTTLWRNNDRRFARHWCLLKL